MGAVEWGGEGQDKGTGQAIRETEGREGGGGTYRAYPWPWIRAGSELSRARVGPRREMVEGMVEGDGGGGRGGVRYEGGCWVVVTRKLACSSLTALSVQPATPCNQHYSMHLPRTRCRDTQCNLL